MLYYSIYFYISYNVNLFNFMSFYLILLQLIVRYFMLFYFIHVV